MNSNELGGKFMKKLVKKIAVFMAVLLIASAFAVPQYSEAATVAPKLNVTKKTITGAKQTYKLTVQNQKAGCKYAWKSSNTKIATVKASNGSATVTAVAKGTATVTCTITYSTGTKRILTCAVTVKVPATAVKISNANIVNNVHKIEMGDTYDFNRKITPSTSSDKTYWSVEPAEYGTIDKNGVFTPAKAGTFNIVATAADSAAKAATSTVKDTILVNVVEKTAAVASVALKGADELVITFTTAINPSTAVDTDTKQLTSAIVIAAGKDSKAVQATDFGSLTGTFSDDQKVLTIKASNTFNGVYTVNVSSDVLTKDGMEITPYVKSVSLVDTTPPSYLGSVVDDSGMKTTINFSEAIDISSLMVVSTQSASATTAIETAALTTVTNYVLSTDKKSLTIDLTSVALSNTSKTYTVTLQGIKDIAGNYSAQNFIQVSVYYDTSVKPQASVINITRTAYETITVQFSRSIQPYGTGVLIVNNTPIYSAVVDSDNNKLVHFTLPADVAALSGSQTVSIQSWTAYNTSSTDTTANTPVSRVVNFSPDTAPPAITSSKLTSVNGVYTLILEYSKAVTIPTTKGTLTAKVTTASDDIYPSNNINYTATVDKKTVTLVLESSQMTMSGKYEIAIPAEFVRDAYYNKSVKTSVTVSSTSATSDTTLAAPISITQSTTDASVIVVKFGQKLDITTAQNIANYAVASATIVKAEVVSNASTLAEVNLTLASGSIKYDANYLVTISGVKGHNNTYNAITNYTQMIALKENVAPTLVSSKLTAIKDGVILTFSEPVMGIACFDVYVNGTIYRKNTETSVAYNTADNTITIYFNSYVSTASGLTLIPAADNNLKDANGNAAQISSTVYVY